MTKTTLKQIAEATGVSRTTVSFVLNNKGEEMNISKVVIERVQSYATQHNYRPNPNAQSLRTGKSKVLLVMLEDIHSKMARYMERFALEKGYTILFCSNENSDIRSRSLLNQFRKHLIDGYIVVPSPNIKPEIEQLIASKIPVVLCDRYFPRLEIPHVVVENKKSMQKATEQLILNGNTSFAYIGINSNQTQIVGRVQGFRNAVIRTNLNHSILNFDTSKSDTEEAINEFIDVNIEADAFVFATGYIAKRALLYIHKTYPQRFLKINYLTFDDFDWFNLLPINITSIRQPISEIASTCINQIIDLIEHPEKSTNTIKTELGAEIVRRILV